MLIKKTWCFWLSYLGTNYCGWQKQPYKQSIEYQLIKAFQSLDIMDLKNLTAAGRTDSGVHAKKQAFSCSFASHFNKKNIIKALNHFLPYDIVIFNANIMKNSFNAQKHSIGKQYLYRINNDNTINPFNNYYVYHFKNKLNLSIMKKTAQILLGENNFSSFKAKGCYSKNPVKYLWKLNIKKKKKEIQIDIRGNAFCYKMIRIIIGTLIDSGFCNFKKKYITKILLNKNRSKAGKTAPAKGLTLLNIYYPDNLIKSEIPNKIIFPKIPINKKNCFTYKRHIHSSGDF